MCTALQVSHTPPCGHLPCLICSALLHGPGFMVAYELFHRPPDALTSLSCQVPLPQLLTPSYHYCKSLINSSLPLSLTRPVTWSLTPCQWLRPAHCHFLPHFLTVPEPVGQNVAVTVNRFATSFRCTHTHKHTACHSPPVTAIRFLSLCYTVSHACFCTHSCTFLYLWSQLLVWSHSHSLSYDQVRTHSLTALADATASSSFVHCLFLKRWVAYNEVCHLYNLCHNPWQPLL